MPIRSTCCLPPPTSVFQPISPRTCSTRSTSSFTEKPPHSRAPATSSAECQNSSRRLRHSSQHSAKTSGDWTAEKEQRRSRAGLPRCDYRAPPIIIFLPYASYKAVAAASVTAAVTLSCTNHHLLSQKSLKASIVGRQPKILCKSDVRHER